MLKKSNCNHDWWYYSIGSFPVLYRGCRKCGRQEYDEMPMAVWKYIPSTKDEIEQYIERYGVKKDDS